MCFGLSQVQRSSKKRAKAEVLTDRARCPQFVQRIKCVGSQFRLLVPHMLTLQARAQRSDTDGGDGNSLQRGENKTRKARKNFQKKKKKTKLDPAVLPR